MESLLPESRGSTMGDPYATKPRAWFLPEGQLFFLQAPFSLWGTGHRTVLAHGPQCSGTVRCQMQAAEPYHCSYWYLHAVPGLAIALCVVDIH
ncbi:hypothetical protein MRX96_047212 [Rhipicephalus microplus]